MPSDPNDDGLFDQLREFTSLFVWALAGFSAATLSLFGYLIWRFLQ